MADAAGTSPISLPQSSNGRLEVVIVLRNSYPRDRFQPDELTKRIVTARNSKRSIEGYSGELRSWLYLIAALTGTVAASWRR